MTWLTPGIALIAAGILVPLLVLLYFLKLRRREVEVSSTFLWKKSIEDFQANAPFQKLRRNLLLLLQLLALAAGLLALAQPELRADRDEGSRRIILIDRSASMSATDAGDDLTRLQRAQREALRFIDTLREPSLLGLGERDEAMVIAFDASAQVLQPFTSDKARLRAAIESIQPTDAPTLLDEALRLSGAYARPAAGEDEQESQSAVTPIHLWSDGRIHDASSVLLPSGAALTHHTVGAPETTNIGITALRAERAFDDPERISVFVGVQSTNREPADVDIELSIDGLVAAVRPAPLPAADDDEPAAGGVVFTLDRASGGLARARLVRDDALLADNDAWLALAPARRLAVALVGEGDLFLQTALEGLSLARLTRFTPDQFRSADRRGELASYDVIVMSGWAPDEPLPPGRYLIFGAAPVMQSIRATGVRDEPSIAIDWSREHPMLRHITLDNLIIARDLTLAPTDEARILARSDAGPIIVEAAERGVRAVVASFKPADSNWPFDPGFVVAVAAAIRVFGAEGAAVTTGSVTPGQVVSMRLPDGATDIEQRTPDGRTEHLTASPDGAITFGPIRTAGLHRISWRGSAGAHDAEIDGRAVRFIAANLLSPEESDIGARDTIGLASGDVRSASSAGEAGERRRLWPLLILTALALVMLEWHIYNRRVMI